MSGFTRGPWRSLGSDFGDRYLCPLESNDPICLVTWSRRRTEQQNKANFDLLSDAPALHEALEKLVSAVEVRKGVDCDKELAIAKALLDKHKPAKGPNPLKLVT